MLEALTDIPESIFSEMMSAVSSQEVNWLEVIETGTLQGYHKDTSGISKRVCDCEGECECDGKGKGIQEGGCKAGEIQPGASLAEAVDWFLACHPDCQRVPRMQAEQVLNQCLDDQRRLTPKAATALNTMARHYAGAAMRKPLGHLENYLAGRQIQGPTRQRALGRED
jgi:hypothetical protein